jgi:manganese/zinc/iron transport system permease protein
MVARDVWVIGVLGGGALLGLALIWKEAKLLSFDRSFGASLGIPMARVDLVLTSLLVLSIVVGLQAVGVVLMSTLVVAPAAAARQWTDHLGRTVALAAGFGAVAGVVGAVVSSTRSGFPTGPTIVVVASVFVLVSILFAPRRGIVAEAIHRRVSARRLRAEAVLADLAVLAAQHDGASHAHPVAVLRAMRDGAHGVETALRRLEDRGWAARDAAGWSITAEGRARVLEMEGGETPDVG